MVTRDLQAQLIGAGGQDEVLQAGHLGLPAEPADPPVLQAMDPPPGLRRGCRRADLLELAVGQPIDQAGPEERRVHCVPST